MPWTADSLYQQIHPDNTPDASAIRGIINELYTEWVNEDCPPEHLHIWAAERFGLTIDGITEGTLKDGTARRITQIKKLHELMKSNDEIRADGDLCDRLVKISKIMTESRNSLRAACILFYQMDEMRSACIPDKWNPDSFFQFIDEDEKATNYQKILLYVLKELSADNYRRLDDQCFRQVHFTDSFGIEDTQAWEYVCDIKDYINQKVQKETCYTEWKYLTNPHDNSDKVVSNLLAQEHMEFPTLRMNRFMWSYQNGIYNVKDDMFWPFRTMILKSASDLTLQKLQTVKVDAQGDDVQQFEQQAPDMILPGNIKVWNVAGVRKWIKLEDVEQSDVITDDGKLKTLLEAKVVEFTSQINSRGNIWNLFKHDTSPPNEDIPSVCIRDVEIWGACADGSIPLDAVFKLTRNDVEYFFSNRKNMHIDGDIYTLDEPVFIQNVSPGTVVQIADGTQFRAVDVEFGYQTIFKMGDDFFSNVRGREYWPELAKDITACRQGMHFINVQDVTREKIQQLDAFEPGYPLHIEAAMLHSNVYIWNVGRKGQLSRQTIFQVDNQFFDNSNGRDPWYYPSGDKYVAEPPTHADVSVKFFDQPFRFEINSITDMTFDPQQIELPELKTIMKTQDLDEDTQMWLTAFLCRLFFPVGFDRWQVCLFIKGIAGSGKSTIAQIMRFFYHPRLISTLSANMEGKFGLSSIYKGLICICAEVRENFGLDQGDWQSACSGEEVSISIKNKTAIQHKWDTPFLWLGNELPNYRNNSGSVERRFFMIEFGRRVKKSDPNLFSKFLANIDLFQRKGVALYHQLLHTHGNNDIWAENVVGEQIKQFKKNVRSSCDALYSFLDDSSRFTMGGHLFMPAADFIEMYNEYRRENNFGRIQFTRDHYGAWFQEFDLCYLESAEKRNYHGTEMLKKFITGIDISVSTTE